MEILKLYSTTPSFFAKKRVESGIAFIIAEWGMVFFLLKKYPDLTMTDIIMWASIQFTISGYILHQIQINLCILDISETTCWGIVLPKF